MNGLISQAHISHRPTSRPPSPVGAVAVLIAAALFAAVLSGCGKKSETATSETTGATSLATITSPTSATPGAVSPEAAQIVADSAKATTALRSVHAVVTVTNLPKLPFESVNADVTNQPEGNGQAVGDAKVRMKPDTPAVDTEFLVTHKTLYTKKDGAYTSVGPAVKIYDPGIILSKERGLGAAIGQVQNPKIEGHETVNGVATVKVSGTIDAAVIDPIVPQLGKDGGTLPVTLWITDVAAAGPDSAANLVQMVIDKDEGNVNIALSNWGVPVTIPNPEG